MEKGLGHVIVFFAMACIYQFGVVEFASRIYVEISFRVSGVTKNSTRPRSVGLSLQASMTTARFSTRCRSFDSRESSSPHLSDTSLFRLVAYKVGFQ